MGAGALKSPAASRSEGRPSERPAQAAPPPRSRVRSPRPSRRRLRFVSRPRTLRTAAGLQESGACRTIGAAPRDETEGRGEGGGPLRSQPPPRPRMQRTLTPKAERRGRQRKELLRTLPHDPETSGGTAL
uniref:Uncharacterized protein n=1 Tax=Pipistrellus kuhlii TaxID=59472 RepID=A0A7J7VMG4_PIPKU|nr:hypothetical protein mPipKuh1_008422 [Pipistrellus kuhlii]